MLGCQVGSIVYFCQIFCRFFVVQDFVAFFKYDQMGDPLQYTPETGRSSGDVRVSMHVDLGTPVSCIVTLYRHMTCITANPSITHSYLLGPETTTKCVQKVASSINGGSEYFHEMLLWLSCYCCCCCYRCCCFRCCCCY